MMAVGLAPPRVVPRRSDTLPIGIVPDPRHALTSATSLRLTQSGAPVGVGTASAQEPVIRLYRDEVSWN